MTGLKGRTCSVRGVLVAVLAALGGLAFPASAFEGHPDHGRIPVRPETPTMHIGEPAAGRVEEPPTRVTVFFQRFEEDLNAASVELWIDGIEYTESLRFWTDRAWLDLPRAFQWPAGDHLIQASVRDPSGNTIRDTLVFNLPPDTFDYLWPFDYNTANVVANLMEDYQRFAQLDPQNEPYWHHGLDIRADAGAPVAAVIGGYVAYRGCYLDCSPLQYNVTILGDDGLLWQYSHLSSGSISSWQVGDRIEAGEQIGNIVTWWTSTNGAIYNHLHLNAVELEGFDPDAWRAIAEDPMQTPPAVPAPLSANFKWHNPLRFLAATGDQDGVSPDFTGETNGGAPDIVFTVNDSSTGIPPQMNNEMVLAGNVDICAHLSDERDVLAGLSANPDGQPYTLGLYEVAYSVVPIDTPCHMGWIPRTTLARFDTVPGEYDVALQDLLLLDVFQETIFYGMATFDTTFEYTVRNFWYNLTNSFYGTLDGQKGYWNTDGATIQGPLFPDGTYRVRVYAVDFAGNEITQSVDVTLNNGLTITGFCPNRITSLSLPDIGGSPIGGSLIRYSPPAIPVEFDPVIEGSSRTTIAAADWPAWYFDDAAQSRRVAVGVLNGQNVNVEYIPYLGDVVLEIPAEVQVLSLSAGGPAPQFDPNAPSQNPVSLRMSTRLARVPTTGEALLGVPLAVNETQFEMVMAESINAGGQPWLVRTIPGASAEFAIAIPGDFDEDGDADLADFAIMDGCYTGPDGGPAAAGCEAPDMDLDNRVDLKDARLFQNAFTGP